MEDEERKKRLLERNRKEESQKFMMEEEAVEELVHTSQEDIQAAHPMSPSLPLSPLPFVDAFAPLDDYWINDCEDWNISEIQHEGANDHTDIFSILSLE